MAYTLVPTELIVDGAVTSAKLDTNIAISGTLGVTGELTLSTHMIMGDNDKIKIGTGGDLEIYHDGSNSYISNSTGNIYLGDTNGSVHIQAKLNEESIVCTADGSVSLYYDNAVKLATTSTGIDVTSNDSTNNSVSTLLKLSHTTTGTAADGIGTRINFESEDDGGTVSTMGYIDTLFTDVSDGAEKSAIQFYTRSGGSIARQMHIDSTGVGIGTDNPDEPLHIFSTTDADLLLEGTETGTSTRFAKVAFANNISGTTTDLGAITADTDGATNSSAFKFYTANAGSVTNKMTVTSGGNVLVDKSNTDRQTVGHEFRAGGFARHTRDGNNPLELVRLTSDGDLQRFYKDGSLVGSIASRGGTTTSFITNPASGSGAGISGSTNMIIACDETGAATGSTVSLGSTSTKWKDLYLSGTANAASLSVDGGTIKLDGNYPTGTGNVALGNAALDDGSLSGANNTAIGNVSLTANTSGANNVAVGSNTLQPNTTGSNNTALGKGSLASNTTASNNTAVGFEALVSNTTGYSNTAVGKEALSANTTGANNTAVGFDAAKALTTATYSAFFGASAGIATTTGQYNTALGAASFIANTTGANNTAVGTSALRLNTTASNNTALGFEALEQNTIGADNTAVGYLALDDNTTGSNNTAMGSQSMNANTTGASNTAMGLDSLASNTTGSNNIAVGRGALYTNTTASNNTALGYSALNANTTGTTNTAVGNSALISNTTGSNNTAVGFEALELQTTGTFNTAVGMFAGKELTTGQYNTFIGSGTTAGVGNFGAGSKITTGSKNTIIGGYNGNESGLDIRTSSNHIVLSDGDGNPRMIFENNGIGLIGTTTRAIGTLGNANGFGVAGNSGSTFPMVVFDEQDPTVEGGSCILELSYSGDTSFSTSYYTLFSDSGGTQGHISGTGAGTVSYNTSSDSRLKENIVDTSSQLDKVKQIQVRDFNYIGKDVTNTGMIAQELNEIIPEVVTEGLEDATKHPWGVDYGKLTPYLIKAIQEQQTIIDDLKSRIETLENE